VINDEVDVADVEEEKENPVAKNDDVSWLLLLVATTTAAARRIARICSWSGWVGVIVDTA
jgi:hypothetical protein